MPCGDDLSVARAAAAEGKLRTGEPVGGGDRTWKGGHLDVQLTRSDWDATPRRDQISIWLWCNGVPENRGAMRVLPGSVSGH